MKRILIACEYSGIVRETFSKENNFDVWSADILDTEIESNKHYKGNVLDILNEKWDCLIAFPPCTYLSAAGLYLCNKDKYFDKAVKRKEKRKDAVDFFLKLYNAPIKHICIENPVGYISTNILKHSQIIHPYYFGEPHLKRTCLWLKNLPKLLHIKENDLFYKKTHCNKPNPLYIEKKTGKKRYFTDAFFSNKLKDQKERSRTFTSIANAMFNQWHLHILNN